MTKKRLILHIGTEKTATTSIQAFLYANRDILAQHGCMLCDIFGVPNNQKIVAYFQNHFDDYLMDAKVYDEKQKQVFFEGFEEEVEREFTEKLKTGNTIVITSELFHSRLLDQSSIDKLNAFLRKFFDEIKIVCYIREQSSLAKSLYSTTIKSGNTGSFEKFLQEAVPTNHYYNYQIFLEKWKSAFGKEALAVKLFDRKYLYDGDILKDFILEISSPDILSDLNFKLPKSNTSLGELGVEIGRNINTIYPRYKEDGSINHFRWELINYISKSELCTKGTIINRNANDIFEAFAESNIEVSKEFLGKDENPFPPPKSETRSAMFASDDEWKSAILSFVEGLFSDVIQNRIVEKSNGTFLREVAELIAKKNGNLQKAKATLELAQRLNPEGQLIAKRLHEISAKLN